MTLEQRFWLKVDKNGPPPVYRPDLGPCWLWLGTLTKGYGHFRVGSRLRYAHRVAYELCVGPIQQDLQSDHLCRVSRCVNPNHLEPVTSAENCRRGLGPSASGSRMLAKTHCPQGHPYAGENLYARPNGARVCRACNRERDRLRWARRKAAA